MNKVSTLIKELDLTQATRFVLPMLYTKDRSDDFFITKNFNNCYIGDANHPEFGPSIYLLYDYKLTLDYIKFERKLELIPEYDTDYDYSDERQVMYIFKIPEEHLTDFMLFKLGNYSKFSEELKTKILSFWKLSVGDNLISNILYGVQTVDQIENDLIETVADKEVWPKPLLMEEIYMLPK